MICRGGHEGRMIGAHRVSYEIARGALDAGVEVLHRCDNPPCVNPAHLVAGTHAENMADMKTKGRSAVGGRNGHAKLTDEEVAIVFRRAQSENRHELAREFGVSAALVTQIKNRRRWRHVTDAVVAATDPQLGALIAMRRRKS